MNFMPKRAAGAFDVEAWKEELLKPNEWARGLTIDEKDGAFQAARQKATLERYAKGRETWNAWANALLAARQVLESARRWAIEDHGRAENEERRAWLALAAAAFSTDATKHGFEGVANFADM